jgi:hypothetical protein
MIDGGPFHNGASAKLIIDDEFTLLGNIKDRFEPVIGVAFGAKKGGQLNFQLVASNHRTFAETLKNAHVLTGLMLPVFVILTEDDPPSDATPEPVS